MSKALIIGSSHVGAYKNAADMFAELYPEAELDYFGVRGPLFLSGGIDKAGRFIVPFRDEKDRAFVVTTNGSESVATSGYDHLLLVGHRFAFVNFAALLRDHDILEGARTDKPRVISEVMLREIIETVTDMTVKDALRGFEDFGGTLTFAMAPYPASSIVERCGELELADVLDSFWAQPDAAWVYDTWLNHLRNALAAKGHHLLEQPDAVNDGLFATKPKYARKAATLNDGTLGKKDHRHMNADYGLAMLSVFAETRLGLTPQGAMRTSPQKKKKERIA